jgi:nitrilase
MSEVLVAAVQAAPVFLDKAATLDKARTLIKEAAELGAGLVVFPESFVPAYPDWVWRTPAWSSQANELYGLLLENAVDMSGPDGDFLAQAARDHGVHLSMGVTERFGSTLYCTLTLHGPDGSLLRHHRKLMPTGGERLAWGYGDGSTLGVVDTPIGRIGGLICWENYMPLARAAIYAQGVEIYLAPTWDTSDVWVPTLQHIAKEGQTYVVGCCQAIRSADFPDGVPGRDELWAEDEWLARGLSTIVGPGGNILAGPLEEKEGIVSAVVDVSRCASGRGRFDPSGHYSRPDVFQLRVDTAPKRPVTTHSPDPDAQFPPED